MGTDVTVTIPLRLAVEFVEAVGTYLNGIEQSIDEGYANPRSVKEVVSRISEAIALDSDEFTALAEEYRRERGQA